MSFIWFYGCTIPSEARNVWGELGGNLTVIYSSGSSSESAAPKTASRPTGILPLLVILFIVSYGILAMLVFEQGQTIESQRGLIREMLKDSTQLAALKGKLARDDGKRPHDQASMQVDPRGADASNPAGNSTTGAAAGAKALGQGLNKGLNQGSNQGSNPGLDKETKPQGKSARTTKVVPGKPAADLEDVRRFTGVI
jgi:hypothetical protein